MRKGLYSVIYMFIVTLCFTSVVSGIRLFNEDKIQAHLEARQQRVILDVLNIPAAGTGPEDIVKAFHKRVKPLRVDKDTLYAGYDVEGLSVTGYAFSVTGPGFWGPLSCMVGIDRNAARIIGVNFYRNTETPGLGARITESWFQDQFTDLPLTGKDQGPLFTLTRSVSPKDPNEFDAITGATETSRAVEKLLNRELKRIVNEVMPLLGKET